MINTQTFDASSEMAPSPIQLAIKSNQDREEHDARNLPVPHGGFRPVHQKSYCLTQSTLGSNAVQVWSRTQRISRATEGSNSTEWIVSLYNQAFNSIFSLLWRERGLTEVVQLSGSTENPQPLQGYLAHKKRPPP